MVLPKGHSMPEMELEWKVPAKSNAIERDRARSYHQAYSAAVALYNLEKALVKEVRAGRTKSWADFKVPQEAVSVGFHEAARGVLSHHMVIRDGKIANYQPYPPTPWNASPRDTYGTPGTLRGRGAEHADLRGERPGEVQGRGHHAGGAELRPVPALRRPHVHRRGKVRKVMHTAHRARRRRRGRRMAAADSLERDPAADGGSSSALPDPSARAVAEELAAAVVELYGEGLERLSRRWTATQRLRLADDGVVGSLLLIHGLHPVPLEERVQAGARPGAAVHEVARRRRGAAGIEDGVARLRLEGSCNGCGASSSTLELAVEKALAGGRARPARACEVEGAVQIEVTGTPLPLAPAGRRGRSPRPRAWQVLEGRDDLADDELRAVEVGGRRLVVARVEGELLAYLDRCAACGAPLAGGELSEGVLACPACERALLPAARRPLARRRAAPAGAGAAAA